MPSAINIRGHVTRRPGAYGEGDASRLSGRVVNLNRVALVGDFPELQQATPRELSGPRRISEINPSSDKLSNIALWLYNPFNDDRIRGGPSAVVMVSTRETTQANRTYLDGAAAASLQLLSSIWGPAGNRTRTKIALNTDDATLRDITLTRDAVTEEWVALGSGNLLTIAYDGAGEATDVTLFAEPGILAVVNVKDDVAVPSVFVPSTMVFDEALKLTPNVAPGAPASGKTLDVTIQGIDKATGLPAVEVILQWLDDDASTHTSTTKWSSVSSIASVITGGAATTLLNVEVSAFLLTAAEIDNIAQAADIINAEATAGYSATALPQAERVVIADIDAATGSIWDDVVETPQSVRADLWSIITTLGSSLLVTPVRPAGADSPPAVTVGEVRLQGGSQLASQDYAAAFDALRNQDVQIIWMESDLIADIKLGRGHCQYMAGAGRGERDLWAGSTEQKTLQELFDSWTTQANTRHVGICPQEPLLTDHRGRDVWMTPPYMALLFAGGQAGTNVGVPLTKKYINVSDVRQHPSWDPDAEADPALARGLAIVNNQRLGWQVERSITTYLVDDNPVYSEKSTNESFNTSIRVLREQVEAIIGDPGVETTQGRIRSIAVTSLDQQVTDQIIKAYNAKTITVDDLGDAFRINYEFKPIEPVNFVIVAASAVRKFSGQ